MSSGKKLLLVGFVIVAGVLAGMVIYRHFHPSDKEDEFLRTMKDINEGRPHRPPVQPRGDAVPPPQELPPDDKALGKKLREMHHLHRQSKGVTADTKIKTPEERRVFGERFREALRASAPDYAEVKAGYEAGICDFTNITMNRLGGGFDCIRFKNESKEAMNMVWAYVQPKNSTMFTWYILPVNGDMMGFDKFWRGAKDYNNVPWAKAKPPYKTTLQSLMGGQIEPGQEYILWFFFDKWSLENFYFTIKLLPSGTQFMTLQAHEEALGMTRKGNAGGDLKE